MLLPLFNTSGIANLRHATKYFWYDIDWGSKSRYSDKIHEIHLFKKY